MSSFGQDLRFTLRGFRRAPAFTAIAAITLALGIGANAAIFSVVDAVVLRPLPYPDAESLVIVEQLRPQAAGQGSAASFPDFVDWRTQNDTFASMAAWHNDGLVLTGFGTPVQLNGEVTTSNFFEVLGVSPGAGRAFAAGEDVDGKNQVAVLSHASWQKHFGGARDIVGRTVTLDDTPYTVIGVMPKGFRFVAEDTAIDVFVPMPRAFDRELKDARGAHYLQTMGRLKKGVTLEMANANLGIIGGAQAKSFPDSNAGRVVKAVPMQTRLTGPVRPALLILLGAVGFVLLIACANVANLLLARASVRQREMAVRTALGASRGRIIRQLLTESVVLSLFGAALGVGLAMWGLDALRELVPADISRFREITVDARVLVFTGLIAIATGVAFGLVPALQASSHDPGETLKEAGTRSVRGPRQKIRSLFVIGEIAVATVLLVGAGLMLRSFERVNDIDPGFKPDHLLVGGMLLPDTHYKDDARMRAFYRDFGERLEALPGVEAVTLGTSIPYNQFNMSFRFTIVGDPPQAPDQKLTATHYIIGPSHFKTLGIPLEKGREITRDDDRETAAPVVMVNEAFARKYFPTREALGQKLIVGWRGGAKTEKEIVGVVGDVRITGLEDEATPIIYAPYNQVPFNVLTYAIRTKATTGLAEGIRTALAAVDPNLPMGDLDTMEKLMSQTMAQRRLNTLLLGVFGAVALLLAIIGVYGVMSYTVTQRVPEIGIRMALGARPLDVLGMVVGHGLLLAGIGVAAGLVGALGVSRVLVGLLYGVSATDPITYGGIAVVLIGVAILASWLPARRAAKVDPMQALRSE